ncbi:MAG: TIGR00730 family Rossman fold protein [Deltaproteobacteria bacterium CG11_big_fil_rev_8_21_14_0_20_45_16]|nr:MAG: TIGR00730 family Rossman fold protein [Deltaproteobacteria bacterium CG11_big_fil_rev_8_21_14_0_20_45_16]
MKLDLSEFQNPYERTTRDTWLIFKILAEFVDGFELMRRVDPAVSIFGSARLKANSAYGKMTERICETVTSTGFSLITGGGPGLMEAANKGARRGINTYKRRFPKDRPPASVGLAIQLPFEPSANEFVDLEIKFRYFFVRKVMFAKYARAFIIMPGGFGTLDELFEALTLIQTNKMERFPIVMMGRNYWEGLIEWMKKVCIKQGALSQKHLDLIHITDDPEEAVEIIARHYTDLVSLIQKRKDFKSKRKPKSMSRAKTIKKPTKKRKKS